MAYSCPNDVTLFILVITFSILRTNAQISTACTSSMISTFTPCLSYVTGSSGRGSSPTQDCCDSLRSLTSQSVDCTCLIVTGNVPLSIPLINRNLAISLPKICQSSVPIECKASGDPLPPPGPAIFQPSPVPAASAPHSRSPKDDATEGVATPAPVESPEVEPSNPEFQLGPSTNPGIRPLVDPKSATNRASVSLLYHVLLIIVVSLAIMSLEFFGFTHRI